MRLIVADLSILVTILQFAIFARAILTWFPIGPDNPIVRILIQVTEPVLAPLRRIVPRVGMVDLTPMAAIFVLYIVRQGLAQLGG
jgi:YggT family protein